MKKILCLVITIMLMMTCIGCSDSKMAEAEQTESQESLFVIVESDLYHGYWYSVCYHKDTKVMYTIGQYNEFTVMLDADGKPLLWKE